MPASRHRHYHRHRRDDRRTSGDDVDAMLRTAITRCGLLSAKTSEPLSERRSSNGGGVFDNEYETAMDTSSQKQCFTSGANVEWADWDRLADVATFERLTADYPSSAMRRKLLDDLRVGDRLCASVARSKIVVLELTLLCTIERFRRCISVFMPNERFVVAYDRSKKVYQTGDYVTAHVTAIDSAAGRLELAIREEEAILQSHQLPAYYRNHIIDCRRRQRQRQDRIDEGESDKDEPTDYDHNDAMRRLRGNANLAELLAVRVDVVGRSALHCFEGRPLFDSAGTSASTAFDDWPRQDDSPDGEDEAMAIRRRQNRRLAMDHVERGAELTRAGRCFEAIQCFNRAINVDETCADAFVGRGAACAGSKNFSAALCDFDKALELDAHHRNAKRYRVEVLIAFGRSLEKDSQLANAYGHFARAYELSGRTNERAAAALQRLADHRPKAVEACRIVEVVDLAADEDNISTSSASASLISSAKRRKLDTSTTSSGVGGRNGTNEMTVLESSSFLKASRIPTNSGGNTTQMAGCRPEDDGDFEETTAMATGSSFVGDEIATSPVVHDDVGKAVDEEENRRKLREIEAFIESLKG